MSVYVAHYVYTADLAEHSVMLCKCYVL